MQNSQNPFFPDEDVLIEVREKLSDPNCQGLSMALSDDATELERAKFSVCQLIVRYQREAGLQQEDLAKLMHVDKARVSEIVRGKIGHFTLDRLLDYCGRLMPEIKVKISAA